MNTKRLEEMTTADFDNLVEYERKMDGSFYLFSAEAFERNIKNLKKELKEASRKTIVAYAMKANYMPYILHLAIKNDCWLEAASELEARMALRHAPASKIIYNGPNKNPDLCKEIAESGGLVMLSSFSEIQKIKKALKEGEKINIGIRYNSSQHQNDSRFGFNRENQGLRAAIDNLQSSGNFRIIAIHCHYSTKDKKPEEFADRLSQSLKIIKEESLTEAKYIDIGGGLHGPMSPEIERKVGYHPPTYKDYARELATTLSRNTPETTPDNINIIIEPGVSLVADSMVFVCRVTEAEKKDKGKMNITINSSFLNINPTGSKTVFPPIIKGKSSRTRRPYIVNIHGNTCMENDRLENIETDQAPEVGDFLIFENRGAYSINRSSAFIHPRPGVIDTNGAIQKKAECLNDILSEYNSDFH